MICTLNIPLCTLQILHLVQQDYHIYSSAAVPYLPCKEMTDTLINMRLLNCDRGFRCCITAKSIQPRNSATWIDILHAILDRH